MLYADSAPSRWPRTPACPTPNSPAAPPAALRLPLTWLAPLITQAPAMGALPTLRAATDPAALGGQYYGPSGRNEIKGRPAW
nr:hypothetical protein GCM10020092_053890 [Actinoplanes digitatis]